MIPGQCGEDGDPSISPLPPHFQKGGSKLESLHSPRFLSPQPSPSHLIHCSSTVPHRPPRSVDVQPEGRGEAPGAAGPQLPVRRPHPGPCLGPRAKGATVCARLCVVCVCVCVHASAHSCACACVRAGGRAFAFVGLAQPNSSLGVSCNPSGGGSLRKVLFLSASLSGSRAGGQPGAPSPFLSTTSSPGPPPNPPVLLPLGILSSRFHPQADPREKLVW